MSGQTGKNQELRNGTDGYMYVETANVGGRDKVLSTGMNLKQSRSPTFRVQFHSQSYTL
jgi:hypothetical protein